MVTREINWVPSIEKKYDEEISLLENQLSKFYSANPTYYDNINFTAEYWNNRDELGFKDIVQTAEKSSKILEVGCGAANILKYHYHLSSIYTGCDFSEDLLENNKVKYPAADFVTLIRPNILPFPDASFDLIFSVYVIEHSANPAKFLDECFRVLNKNGVLIILCPNFLGHGRMSSQRAGFSAGTTNDKLIKHFFWDALVTFFDNKIRIPLYCKLLSLKTKKSPRFFVNLKPTVFTDRFVPDVDAVYVTNKYEIISYLKNMILVDSSTAVKKYEERKKIMYIKLMKPNIAH